MARLQSTLLQWTFAFTEYASLLLRHCRCQI